MAGRVLDLRDDEARLPVAPLDGTDPRPSGIYAQAPVILTPQDAAPRRRRGPTPGSNRLPPEEFIERLEGAILAAAKRYRGRVTVDRVLEQMAMERTTFYDYLGLYELKWLAYKHGPLTRWPR